MWINLRYLFCATLTFLDVCNKVIVRYPELKYNFFYTHVLFVIMLSRLFINNSCLRNMNAIRIH